MTTKTWTGGTGNYSVGANWSDGHAPGDGDTGIFDAGVLQIGAITIAASTHISIGGADPFTELHIQLIDTRVDGSFLAADAGGTSTAYDIAGTLTLGGTLEDAGPLGLMDFNDLSTPATLQVASGGVIQDQSADLNLAVSHLINDGTIANFNAYEYVSCQTVTGSGTFTLATQPLGNIPNANTMAFVHAVGGGLTVAFTGSGAGELLLVDPSTFAATIAGFNTLTDIELNNIQADTAQFSNGTLTVTNAGSLVAHLSLAGSYGNDFFVDHVRHEGDSFVDPNNSFIHFGAVACFASGTRIRSARGDVAVESLAVGDLVLLSDGDTAPVRWLGHRRIDCRRHPRPADVCPVRVAAGAFAAGMPVRDLLLSPHHAVLHDGVLIPIRYLLNGTTVRQEECAEITYWHVELPRHAVLLAEGLPAESFLDTGNRDAFANGGGATMLHADFAPRAQAIWDAESCAPLALAGPAVARAQAALAARINAAPPPPVASSRRAVRMASSRPQTP